MCVCIQVCMYTALFVYRCMCICVCVYRCVCLHTGVCVYVCLYTGVLYVCVYRCVCVCIQVYVYICVDRCMCLCVYTDVCVCLRVCRCLKTTSSIIETGSFIGQEFTDSARPDDQQILRMSRLHCPSTGIPSTCHHTQNFYADSGGHTQVLMRVRQALY